jgi:hypothetical protein
LLSQAIGEKVNKTNLHALLEQHLVNHNNRQHTDTTTAMSGVALTAERYVLESPEGQVPLASGCTLSDRPLNKPVIKKFSNPVHSFASLHLEKWVRLP